MIEDMRDLLQTHVSDREADRRAREWLESLDHRAAIGSRHHIVPRFLLARFASRQEQLRVRDRSTGATSLRAVSDLAVRDFYTVVTDSHGLDSSLESLLGTVEGGAAEILRVHLDLRAFVRPRAFTPEERAVLDSFVAMQAVRGMRLRRAIEVLTDYSVKFFNQGRLSEDEVLELDFVPHPNDHLRMFGHLAEGVEMTLKRRPLSLLRLDQPLLVIGDEPVVTANYEGASHLAACSVRPGPDMRGSAAFRSLRGGFAGADAVLLAVSPSVAMLYGPTDTRGGPVEHLLAEDEALSFAAEHNELVVASAIDWVAANPDHAGLASMLMPSPAPLLTVSDGGSAAARRVNATAARRPIRRLRADDVPLAPSKPLEEPVQNRWHRS
jgi:Protein of unknown function (DUF4238)